MHFYPGVARYEPPNQEPFTVFINEDTIRKLGRTFAGCPVFVEHVEEVDDDINAVRNEADGWVEESFFNAADGKHWVKFIIVSDRGLAAIQRGFRLSNAYIPECNESGGLWNGVAYQREVTGGEFEHLAIVKQPRYEESVIMTPEEFKAYNEQHTIELKRLANSADKKGETNMGLKFFKKAKLDNSVDFETMMVELPKTKKEVSLTTIINEYDAIQNMNGYANGDHMVKVGEKDEMSVNDLVKKHLEMCNEMEGMKAKNDVDGGEPGGENEEEMESMDNEALDIDQMGDVGDRGGDKSLDNEEDDEKMKKDKMKNAADKKAEAKAKALKLRNAHRNLQNEPEVRISLPMDQVARGKARYGSGK